MTVRRRRDPKRRDRWDWEARRIVDRCPAPWEPMQPADERRLRRVVELHEDHLREGNHPEWHALIRGGRATPDEVAEFIEHERADCERMIAYLGQSKHRPRDHVLDGKAMRRHRAVIPDAPDKWIADLYRQHLAALEAWAEQQQENQ